MSDKIVSLVEFAKRVKLEREVKTADPSLKSILDYRTEKLLELLDHQQRQIEELRSTQRAMTRAFTDLKKKFTSWQEEDHAF